MPERPECEVLQKARYINTLTFYLFTFTSRDMITSGLVTAISSSGICAAGGAVLCSVSGGFWRLAGHVWVGVPGLSTQFTVSRLTLRFYF